MNKLLEVIKHPLDPERFHRLLSKKQCFLLFNLLAIGWAVISGRLLFSISSIVIAAVALAIMNGVAWISSRIYPDWK
jgi:hypothetical protein